MDITILQVRNLLNALGIDHEKWSTKKASLRINALPELLNKATQTPEGDAAALLTAISSALQEGKKIMVTDPDADEEILKPTKATRPKAAVKQKGTEQPKEAKGPSNKELVYKLWNKKKSVTPEEALKVANNEVQLSTIRSWFSAWPRGKGLPACANG